MHMSVGKRACRVLVLAHLVLADVSVTQINLRHYVRFGIL